MRLLIYLTYALGLILIALLVIPGMSILSILWFIFYLVVGIFTLHHSTRRLFYFLVNMVISVVLFLMSLKFLVVLIGMVASIGFLLSIFALSKKESADVQKKEKIKEIIDEIVIKKKEEEPKLEVYERKSEKPAEKKIAKRKQRKKK